MYVGIGRISLRVRESHSLKARRQVSRSLTQRIRGRFNVSVAQDAASDGDAWQSVTLLLSCVSNGPDQARDMLDEVLDYIEKSRPDLELLDYGSEVISGA